ncbi:glycosyltransferase [Polynucleobacter sp. MG-6-Vaara-E2]|uniref:glycosyltransferase n=1 Tax=Polynucleobacter sp. MG-6-Vaara-E2 TaxID=2576932 RepID=UPI001BFDAB20|nr:glycosyltransferase [Polynucleobacter sp. MG-6-Vaara-E2]QWD96923.1 glycosyltransferase [Polynucleobacter sp. MG-6-Vaara-E2]
MLPVFNEDSKILDETLCSISNQSFKFFELIVIDESTDIKTLRLLDQFRLKDERVRIIRPEVRLGLVKSLNLALKYANGEFIARVDSDDPLKEGRFDMQVSFLKHNPEIGVVGSSIELIDQFGSLIGVRNYPIMHKEIALAGAIRNPISHASVMMRRDIVVPSGGYDERFQRSEDYEMWMRLIGDGVNFHNLKTPLIQHRVANEFRRDRLNWYFNLLVKLRYFRANNIFQRLLGIAISLAFLITPKIFHKYFYNYYNYKKLLI